MGLIETISGLASIVATALAVGWAKDEVNVRMPRANFALLKIAVRRLPEAKQERCREEWSRDLEDTDGPISKLMFSLGLLIASFRMHPPSINLDPVITTLVQALLRLARWAAKQEIKVALKKQNIVYADALQNLRYELSALSAQIKSAPYCEGGATGKDERQRYLDRAGGPDFELLEILRDQKDVDQI